MYLSIITINFNNAVGLRKTLASVASQTYPYIEHIIVDGGSTDNSVEVIREYESTLALSPHRLIASRLKWISEKDTGIYNAMNKGLEIALGRRIVNEDHTSCLIASSPHRLIASDYIQILNSGDTLAAPDVTERMMAALAERNGKINNQQSKQLDNQQLKQSFGDIVNIVENDIVDVVEDTKSNQQSKQLDNQQLKHSSDDIVNIVENDIVGIAEDTQSNQQSKQLDNQQLKQSSGDIVNIVENEIVDNRKSDLPAIFYGNMIKEYPDGRRVKDTCGGGDYTPESFLYFYKGTLNHDCAYIRRDLFEKYGLYNEHMKICSDWEWYVRAIVLGGEKTVYTNIDVTVFDMMGVSESGGKNRTLIQQERRTYLESILPAALLRDYDKYAFPIEQYQRLKKYHLWGLVFFVERVLFKLEKWRMLK